MYYNFQMDFKEKINALVSLSKNINVLYVEDEQSVRETTHALLSNVFTSIDLAKNGNEGLELYKTKEYGLIISDILMPMCNGITMLQEIIRQNPLQKVIITSASDEKNHRDELKNIGIKNFITKPVELIPLVDALCEAICENS